MQNYDVILWIILIAAAIAVATFQIIENQRLTKRWKHDLAGSLQKFLTRFAWSRTFQTIAVLVCYSVVIAFYNAKVAQLSRSIIDLSSAQAELAGSRQELEQKNTKLLEANNALTSQISGLNQQLAQQSSSLQRIAEQQQALNESVKSSSALNPQPQPMQAEIASAESDLPDADGFNEQPTIAPINQASIEQVFSPESKADTLQNALDNLKKRYEDILVIHFFLKKCGRAAASDYHVITSALSQEMASLNAPGRLQNDILTAAQGSYREMYSRSDCNAEGVGKLNQQYVEFVGNLSQNYTAP